VDVDSVGTAEDADARAVQAAGVDRFDAAGAHHLGVVDAILDEDLCKVTAGTDRFLQHLAGNVLIQHVVHPFCLRVVHMMSIITDVFEAVQSVRVKFCARKNEW